ncbi:MAG: hypothetical protein AABX51_05460 [Nanoarchaeota archaeon]
MPAIRDYGVIRDYVAAYFGQLKGKSSKEKLTAILSGIKEAPKATIVALVGNRGTFVSASAVAVSVYSAITGDAPILGGNELFQYQNAALAGGLGAAGAFGIVETSAGFSTIVAYYDTRTHIREEGHLEEYLAEEYFGLSKKFHGYCHMQGMYLAAMENGCLDEFRQYEKIYKNINLMPLL